MTDDRRRIRLLAPGDGCRVATEDGRLPACELTLGEEESTLTAVGRLLPDLGLANRPLDVVVDQRSEEELGGATRQALAVLAPPPADWVLPPGWTWTSGADVGDLPDRLAAIAAGRLDELAGRQPVPAERAAWSRSGWFQAVSEWIDSALSEAGRPPAEVVVPIRQWGISAVLCVETADGRVWFKASFPGFGQEAAITAWLHDVSPGSVPRVLAVERERGWLLLDDLGARTEVVDAGAVSAAVDSLVAVQRDTADRLDELRELGASERPLRRLLDDFTEVLDTAVARDVLGPRRDEPLVDALGEALARVDGVLPEVLVHGDFHPGNVALADDGATLFDWSDAAIASPLVDIPTWTWWYSDDERTDVVWDTFEAAWHAEYGVRPGAVDRRSALVVAGAYHTVSYVRMLEALEPLVRHEHAGGVIHFFDVARGADWRGSDRS